MYLNFNLKALLIFLDFSNKLRKAWKKALSWVDILLTVSKPIVAKLAQTKFAKFKSFMKKIFELS